jgi:adenylosuccinate synthase
MALRLRGTGSNPWDEYGSTTGRPRRVGWIDAVALRYAIEMNGIQDLALTKLDVLTGLETLRICTAYAYRGETLTAFPQDSTVLAQCTPLYADLAGWSEDVQGVRRFADLPAATRHFIAQIEHHTGAKVAIASVGPEREQLIVS